MRVEAATAAAADVNANANINTVVNYDVRNDSSRRGGIRHDNEQRGQGRTPPHQQQQQPSTPLSNFVLPNLRLPSRRPELSPQATSPSDTSSLYSQASLPRRG
ncbi:hypothetical protein CP532_2080 [Ophiocordyceps camponoti-leonardi (nom. inval.)]|nr:hypothetical protein CP532_2080 [Ophiocordyceps camponoti-leonardi (nom. inval.)]